MIFYSNPVALAEAKYFLEAAGLLCAVDDVAHPVGVVFRAVDGDCLDVARVDPFAGVASPLESEHEDVGVVVTPENVFVGVDEVVGKCVTNLVEFLFGAGLVA
jgi:hypothetical protein